MKRILNLLAAMFVLALVSLGVAPGAFAAPADDVYNEFMRFRGSAMTKNADLYGVAQRKANALAAADGSVGGKADGARQLVGRYSSGEAVLVLTDPKYGWEAYPDKVATMRNGSYSRVGIGVALGASGYVYVVANVEATPAPAPAPPPPPPAPVVQAPAVQAPAPVKAPVAQAPAVQAPAPAPVQAPAPAPADTPAPKPAVTPKATAKPTVTPSATPTPTPSATPSPTESVRDDQGRMVNPEEFAAAKVRALEAQDSNRHFKRQAVVTSTNMGLLLAPAAAVFLLGSLFLRERTDEEINAMVKARAKKDATTPEPLIDEDDGVGPFG